MALFIPELLSSVACLANILITIFWKKRHTVLGRLVLMLNLSELIWPLTFTDYLQNREWAPNEINIFFIMFCVGNALAWSSCFGDAIYRIHKYGDNSIHSIFWKYTVICAFIGIILAGGFTALIASTSNGIVEYQYYAAIIMSCFAFSLWRYILISRMGSQETKRWKFFIYPAITLVCNLPYCVMRCFDWDVPISEWKFYDHLLKPLWLLQGFFNSSLGIYHAIHYVYKRWRVRRNAAGKSKLVDSTDVQLITNESENPKKEYLSRRYKAVSSTL